MIISLTCHASSPGCAMLSDATRLRPTPRYPPATPITSSSVGNTSTCDASPRNTRRPAPAFAIISGTVLPVSSGERTGPCAVVAYDGYYAVVEQIAAAELVEKLPQSIVEMECRRQIISRCRTVVSLKAVAHSRSIVRLMHAYRGNLHNEWLGNGIEQRGSALHYAAVGIHTIGCGVVDHPPVTVAAGGDIVVPHTRILTNHFNGVIAAEAFGQRRVRERLHIETLMPRSAEAAVRCCT